MQMGAREHPTAHIGDVLSQPHAGRHGDEPERSLPLWVRPELEAPGSCLQAWLPIVYIRVVTGHAALHGEFLGITPGQ